MKKLNELDEHLRRIWAFHDGPLVGMFVGQPEHGPFVSEYIRADVAKAEALRSILSDDGLLEHLARAYDREDAVQRGEPTPWEPGNLEDPHRVEWMEERIACAREGIRRVLAALEGE